MNNEEANALLQQHLDRLEAQGFEALAQRAGDSEVLQEQGPSGTEYQLELDILWDDKPGGAIRVIASIDDGGLRAFLPLTKSRRIEVPPAND